MSEPLDVARYIFINDENELRCGWRIVAFCALWLIAEIILSGLVAVIASLIPALRPLLAQPAASEELGAHLIVFHGTGVGASLAAALIATGVCARALERRSIASVGYKLHRGWLRDFLLGSALGAASLALSVVIAMAARADRFMVQTRDEARIAGGFAFVFCFFLAAAAVEEVVFRGFPFQALVHNLGAVPALAITSVLFGLAHLANPNAGLFSTINTVLAGLWLGAAYLKTRSLWLATALHYSWNFVMAFVFGLPVSGIMDLGSLAWLKGEPGPPTMISGGGYGPEGGAAVTAALILSIAVIWKSRLFYGSEEMLAAIQHGKPEQRFGRITPMQ